MSLSAMDKEVTTRLFHMLAVNEKTAETVKRDHASYAKLSLLTQQAQLLQQQAVGVVNKSAAKAAKDEINLCTALSVEYDDGAKRLCKFLDINEKTISTISRDTIACSKLSLLAEQVDLLQQQAQEAVDDAKINKYLAEIMAGNVAKLVPGTYYYCYTQNDKEVLSRIAPTEWAAYEAYHGKYIYDFDCTFRKQLEGEEKEQFERRTAQKVMLLENCTAAPVASWGGHHVAANAATPLNVAATPATPVNGTNAPVDDAPVDVTEACSIDSRPCAQVASQTNTGTWDRMGMNGGTANMTKPICPVLSRWS